MLPAHLRPILTLMAGLTAPMPAFAFQFTEDFNNLWSPKLLVTAPAGTTVSAANGQAVFTKASGLANAYISMGTCFQLVGDFDVSVDTTRNDLDGRGEAGLAVFFTDLPGPLNFADVFFVGSNGINANIFPTAPPGFGTNFNVSSQITFRIQRTNSTLTLTSKSGGVTQTSLSKTDPLLAGPVQVQLFLEQEYTDSAALAAHFDNLKLSSVDVAGGTLTEDFNGVWNPKLVETSTPGVTSISPAGGQAIFSKADGPLNALVSLNTCFPLVGNFDVTVDVTRNDLDSLGEAGLAVYFSDFAGPLNFADVFFAGPSGINANIFPISPRGISTNFNLSSTVTFRIWRVGQTLNLGFQEIGGNYQTVLSTTNASLTGPVVASLFLQQEYSDPASLTASFDNLNMCADSVVIAPNLTIQNFNPNVVVSWPYRGDKFNLKQIVGLGQGSWSVVSSPQIRNAQVVSVTMPFLSGDVFFRLEHVLCVPRPTGMTGWWPGEGRADDIIGGNAGTLVNGTGFAPGEVCMAFNFDGVSNFVDIPGGPDFGMSDFTIEFWVNFNSLNQEQVMVEKWVQNAADTALGWTFTKLDNNYFRFAQSPNNNIDFGAIMQTGVWMHLAATRSGSHVQTYLNGAPAAGLDGLFDLTSTSSLKFGHRGNPADTPGSTDNRGLYLNGSLDEVSVYNRALTDGEILAVFNAGQAGKCYP